MHKNYIIYSKNMWQYHKTSMDHSKIIDTFETYQRVKRIYNFSVIHANFVILSHVFTINYIIFMNFIGLTYWQDAKCQFPVFAIFVFQKSHNKKYRRIALKIYGDFLCDGRHPWTKGRPGGHPGARGNTLPWAHLGARVGPAPAPWAPPRPPPTPIKSLLT